MRPIGRRQKRSFFCLASPRNGEGAWSGLAQAKLQSANEPEPRCRYGLRTFAYLEPKMRNQRTSLKNEDASQSRTKGSADRGRPEEERRTIAWVGQSVVFKGELVSAEDMVLDGRVEGAINVRDHSLTIGPDADIRADIVGNSVIIRGRVKGKITASEKLHLHETASVEGDVSAQTIVIAEGARLEGQIETLKQRPGGQTQTA